ncbi:hypothetical protein RUM43_004378 [Polyplax serrata]|uniref:Uncharacterized protein n=1 Tax=Polyplax serrata TaxID=468196 RepID=A0AAN8SB57_POLSC
MREKVHSKRTKRSKSRKVNGRQGQAEQKAGRLREKNNPAETGAEEAEKRNLRKTEEEEEEAEEKGG